MGFLTSMMLPARSAVRESEFHGEAAWLADTGDFGAATPAGVRVSPGNAITLSAVFASARAIAEDVAGLPLKAYRRLPGGGKEPANKDPTRAAPGGLMVNLYRLVHDRPNHEMGSFRFRSLMIWWALVYGNAYAQILRVDGYPVAMVPIHPGKVSPKRDDTGEMYYQITDLSGSNTKTLGARDVFHLMGITDDGMLGHVISNIGRNSFGVYMAAERYTGTYFGSGATLKGVVSFDGDFKTAEARAEYISRFNSSYNNNKWLLADNGAKINQLGSDPEKAQLVETLRFRIEDVARWFRVPPVIIGHNTATPYANIEPLNQMYWLTGMKPWALRIEEEGNNKLIAEKESADLFIEHVVEALMWADAKTRAEVQNLRIRGGWGNPNEAREVHNMNPIPGGDKFRIEQNLALLDDDGVPAAVNRPAGPPGQPVPPMNNRDAVKLAMMPALVALSERLVAREFKAISATKSATPDWLGKFYAGHRSWIVSEVGPVIDSMARLAGTDPAGIADRFADQHVGESRRRIEASDDPARWMIDRPAWMASYIGDEVCNG